MKTLQTPYVEVITTIEYEVKRVKRSMLGGLIKWWVTVSKEYRKRTFTVNIECDNYLERENNVGVIFNGKKIK